ncbi:MAG: hypothetical protein KDB53_05550, partial [Planctomycetes bacterium]|nr:hypothetical protein [Planctomycetota bacterium]
MRRERRRRNPSGWPTWVVGLLLAISILIPLGCSGGGGGGGPVVVMPPVNNNPALPPPTVINLTRYEELPGMNGTMTGVAGGSGANGAFMPGDFVSVTFRITNDLGNDIPMFELNRARLQISGPTSNYQPIFGQQSDVREASVDNGDGTYTYTFSNPIPATYPAPINDSPFYGLGDGELQGQPIQSGSYTIGMEIRKDYLIEGVSFRDV